MRLTRCPGLQLTLDDEPRFDEAALFRGGDGLDRSPRWLAWAPDRTGAGELSLAALALLQEMPAGAAIARDDLAARHGAALVDALHEAGWLRDAAGCPPAPAGIDRGGDPIATDVAWWPPALLAQLAGRWHGIDVEARHADGLMPDSERLVADNGPAPTHVHRRRPGAEALPLPSPPAQAFDGLLARRRTCRNFDAQATLPLPALATMLRRVWGAVGTRELSPGAVAVRKSSPAGGGLHAVEAYVLVQRVDGVAPGLHHYLPHDHALEPMRPMSARNAAAAARTILAGQHWFLDAPVLVVMTARFDRLFWKYRRHAKAWRVLHLDAGHLSQTMYLSAADLDLGAFVTAAINDGDIEPLLELDPLREAAIAVVGFGARCATRRHVELDDLVPGPASGA